MTIEMITKQKNQRVDEDEENNNQNMTGLVGTILQLRPLH